MKQFILNHSKAIVANSYLILYPKPDVAAVIAKDPEMVAIFFEALNAITEKVMIDEGRVYGGGMHKLEPRELANLILVESQNSPKNLTTTNFEAKALVRQGF